MARTPTIGGAHLFNGVDSRRARQACPSRLWAAVATTGLEELEHGRSALANASDQTGIRDVDNQLAASDFCVRRDACGAGQDVLCGVGAHVETARADNLHVAASGHSGIGSEHQGDCRRSVEGKLPSVVAADWRLRSRYQEVRWRKDDFHVLAKHDGFRIVAGHGNTRQVRTNLA